MRDICRKEYDLQVDVRLVGKTLYAACQLDGLVGQDLGLQRKTLEKLEGAMLSTTRAALSTDASIDFLVLKARDARLGVTVNLIRYFPDIKGLIFFRVSRSDFENRLILETENVPEPESPDSWKDIPMTEFMARLAASRLQRQFTSNPLVSVFLQVQKVQGRVEDRTLLLVLEKSDDADESNALMGELLRSAVEETASDVLRKYDSEKAVRQVVVKDGRGRTVLNWSAEDLLKPKKEQKPASQILIGKPGDEETATFTIESEQK
ncbi:MAG: hypothetical protein HY548_02540 [Elusimicrobia bacterium]|nr:hypothetical protein [Elusimicrobiota bacterium]